MGAWGGLYQHIHNAVTLRTNEPPRDEEEKYKTLVSYRTGDVWVPQLDPTEALHYVCAEFLDSIKHTRPSASDGAL